MYCEYLDPNMTAGQIVVMIGLIVVVCQDYWVADEVCCFRFCFCFLTSSIISSSFLRSSSTLTSS